MPKAWCDLFRGSLITKLHGDPDINVHVGFISALSSCPRVFRPNNKSAGRSDTESCFRLSGVFTAGTAWRLLLCSHRLYDPSTEQLSRLQLLFEPMQLPSFSPCSRQCAVVISEAEQDRAPWCDTDAPRFFLCCFAKNESCRLSDTIECVLRRLPVVMAQTCVRAVISCAPSIFVR